MIGSARDFRRRLIDWYRAHRRDLPWRVPRSAHPAARPDPYHVLASEAMLQQTQVATVIPYFQRFITEFPTISALAAADRDDVLRLWQGLGYYRRAHLLLAAARWAAEAHGGAVPDDLNLLSAMPGVGRYTAGAIASLAFNQRAPILDGNVARVICRIDKIETDPREAVTRAVLWRRAEELLPHESCGDFNSGLMELGATVCTPRQPKCEECPVRRHCRARADGVQDRIPLPRISRATPLIRRWTFCVRSGEDYLIERRPLTGRWSGMWQFVTIAPVKSPAVVLRALLKRESSPPRRIATFDHALTHRRYRFAVFTSETKRRCAVRAELERAWVNLRALDEYALPTPHVRIASMLRQAGCVENARSIALPSC